MPTATALATIALDNNGRFCSNSRNIALNALPLAPGAAGFLLPGDAVLGRRGGRHRKSRERYPNGQTKHQDQIPEGLAMRRMAILELSGAARDMRAEYPLGVIRARNLILEVEHQAGLEYARLHDRFDRAKTPHSCLGQLMASGEGAIADGADLAFDDPKPHEDKCACARCRAVRGEARYLSARDALKVAGTRAFSTVYGIVIHHRWPRFLDTARTRPPAAWLADARDLAALRSGLGAIAGVLNLQADHHDNFAKLAEDLERRFGVWPSTDRLAEYLLQDSVTSLNARREARLRGG